MPQSVNRKSKLGHYLREVHLRGFYAIRQVRRPPRNGIIAKWDCGEHVTPPGLVSGFQKMFCLLRTSKLARSYRKLSSRVMVPTLHGVGIEAQSLLYRLGLCPGDENGSARGRLGRVPTLPRSVVLSASTVELATVDIVCADVMNGPPTSYQV